MSDKKQESEVLLGKAKAKLDQAMKEQGEACGDACDWHDNNAYDLAVSLTNTYSAIVEDLKKQIKDLK